ELDLLLGVAHREVVVRERRLRRQPCIGEVGRARLGGRRIAFDLPADAAPYVELPGQPAPHAELTLAAACAAGVDEFALAGGAAGAAAAAALLELRGGADRGVEAGRVLPRQP